MFMINPEDLVLVIDKNHPLYDARAADPIDENLVRNIMVYGVKEPVLVRKNGEALEVIDGRQRVKAAIEANKRLTAEGKEPMRVRAIVEKGQEADLFGVLITLNELRREDTPLARADKAKRFIDMGKSEAEAAIAFGVSHQTIRNWLALETLSPPVRKAVEKGDLPATAATKLAGLSSEKQEEKLERLKETGGKITVPKAIRAARNEAPESSRARVRKPDEIKSQIVLHGENNTEFSGGVIAALRWVLNEVDEI
jgi:ParB family chromosome partitioning protein